MSDKHREIHFEADIVAHLTAHGWLEGDPTRYDRALALYPDDLIGWLQETQPQEWAKLAALYHGEPSAARAGAGGQAAGQGGRAGAAAPRLQGRQRPLPAVPVQAQPRLQPRSCRRCYDQVRCAWCARCTTACTTRTASTWCSSSTASPSPRSNSRPTSRSRCRTPSASTSTTGRPRTRPTRQEEPLLTFKRRRAGALCRQHRRGLHDHAAGRRRRRTFLPFNLGNDQGAGNPPNPDGYRTGYLWERVLAARQPGSRSWAASSTWKRTERTKRATRVKEGSIFPRYHQWEVVTQLVAAARAEGTGHNATWSSTRPGRASPTRSPGWRTSLASLHDAADHKVFDSVIVVTDRTVLDKQLQDTIYQFEHKDGVVVHDQRRRASSRTSWSRR